MSGLTSLIPPLYLAVLGLLSLHGVHRLVVLARYWRTRHQAPTPGPTPARPPLVTVQLPVFNEPAVIVRLIDAACALDWPRDRLEIQVLDDSTDETTDLARACVERWRRLGIDITLVHRTDRVGFKAGALAAATPAAKGSLLAVFDADFVPGADFLRQVAPHFAGRPEVGMVQARWGHLNEEDNLLTRLSAILLDGHFVLEHTTRHRTGCFFNFNGTAGIWRKAAIADAGGWQHDTVTEDLDLSYRAQLKGWRFVYLLDHVVPAELPASMRAFKTQQHRWAKGTMQTARKLLPTILGADLPWRVKSEAVVHMTSNLAYPGVLALSVLMPASVFLRGRSDLQRLLLLDLPIFLMATASVVAFYWAAERVAKGSMRGRRWRLPLTLALGIGMAVSQTRATLQGLVSADATFVRTPKVGDGAAARYTSRLDWTPFVELALAAYFSVALVEAVSRGWYASVPFMALFGAGFGYVGLATLLDPAGRTARAAPTAVGHPDPADAAEPEYSVAR